MCRPLCSTCASIVISAHTGPTQAGDRLQRKWQMERRAFLQITASRQAMGVIPSHGPTRELKTQVEMLHRILGAPLKQV